MPHFKAFIFRVYFIFFTSSQFSKASKTEISNPVSIFPLINIATRVFHNYKESAFVQQQETFKYTVTIDSFSVRAPNQNDFVEYTGAKQMLLAIHHEWDTFSFYESGARQTIFTFRRQKVNLLSFHSKLMSFDVNDNNETYNFRVVFSADKHTLDTLYLYLSYYTGITPTVNALKIIFKPHFPQLDKHLSFFF